MRLRIQFTTSEVEQTLEAKILVDTKTIMQFTKLQQTFKELHKEWWVRGVLTSSITAIIETKAKIIIHKNE